MLYHSYKFKAIFLNLYLCIAYLHLIIVQEFSWTWLHLIYLASLLVYLIFDFNSYKSILKCSDTIEIEIIVIRFSALRLSFFLSSLASLHLLHLVHESLLHGLLPASSTLPGYLPVLQIHILYQHPYRILFT